MHTPHLVREVFARDAVYGPVGVEPVHDVRRELGAVERLRMAVQHGHIADVPFEAFGAVIAGDVEAVPVIGKHLPEQDFLSRILCLAERVGLFGRRRRTPLPTLCSQPDKRCRRAVG